MSMDPINLSQAQPRLIPSTQRLHLGSSINWPINERSDGMRKKKLKPRTERGVRQGRVGGARMFSSDPFDVFVFSRCVNSYDRPLDRSRGRAFSALTPLTFSLSAVVSIVMTDPSTGVGGAHVQL